MSIACALRATSDYSFTELGIWTAELTADLHLVVPTTGFEPRRVALTRFGTLSLEEMT